MKALRFHEYGGPLTLDEVPEPACGPGQLRLRVKASSVNPIDWKLHSGALKLIRPVARPATPGLDVAGEVLESKIPGFAEGQRVVARIADVPGGAMAEQCIVSEEVAVHLPDSVDFEDAAALPLAGMTALQGLRDDCGMALTGETRRVLVVGASGGVGHYAVQIAHIAGAHVTAVCSAASAALVRELGADHVIDYREQSHFRTDAPYDIVIDCAAKAPWSRFKEVMAPRSHMSQPTPTPGWLLHFAAGALSGKKPHFTMLKPNATDLGLLLDHLAAGRLQSVIGARFGWADLADAWALNQKGGTPGKIVLTFDVV